MSCLSKKRFRFVGLMIVLVLLLSLGCLVDGSDNQKHNFDNGIHPKYPNIRSLVADEAGPLVLLPSKQSGRARSSSRRRRSTSRRRRKNDTIIGNKNKHYGSCIQLVGGETRRDISSNSSNDRRPSIYWAVLHNWLYFLSLGFNLINIPFLVREIIDGPNNNNHSPSAEAIALSGKVESVDKILTFAGMGLLSALSDKFGRKPLMAWSALGFMVTNFIQARTQSSLTMLYFADFVDGCSSCMLPLCQAYITDVSPPSRLAGNLGIFQGLSAGGAFIFAFPIGGLLGAKFGPRVPLYSAAGLQLLNALIILFLTPESNTELGVKIDWAKDNPIGGLVRLFGQHSSSSSSLLRIASTAYFLTSLARTSLDAQFANYSNIRFGWTQAQSGPVLVVVGFMLAIAPRLLVPRMGMIQAIGNGLLIFALGLIGTGLAPTPIGFVASIFVVSVGCMCLPALQALLANLAPPGERGALLGAVGSLNELTGAIGSTLYASLLAKFTSDDTSPFPRLPGMHFIFGGILLLIAWGIALPGFMQYKNHPAFEC